jgi:Prokaryotic N-terminal methylation motif
MECKITFTNRRRSAGVTLIEMMVAGSIGVIVVGSLVMVQLFANESFASLYNYQKLDGQSHLALEGMTKQIRQASAMTAFATNDVTFTNAIVGGTIRYAYDPVAQTLSSITSSQTNVLLQGCSSLLFSMYQRNPTQSNFNQVVATNAAQCKLFQVQWTCFSSVYNNQTNETEAMLSAKIVLRN